MVAVRETSLPEKTTFAVGIKEGLELPVTDTVSELADEPLVVRTLKGMVMALFSSTDALLNGVIVGKPDCALKATTKPFPPLTVVEAPLESVTVIVITLVSEVSFEVGVRVTVQFAPLRVTKIFESGTRV